MANTQTDRQRMPDVRRGLTRKASACGFEYYVTVSFFDDGRPGEVFVKIAKSGSTVAGLVNAICTTVSMCLQHGAPWESLRDKFLHTQFAPSETGIPSLMHALALTIDEVIESMGEKSE